MQGIVASEEIDAEMLCGGDVGVGWRTHER
jgi:hypothetical protein